MFRRFFFLKDVGKKIMEVFLIEFVCYGNILLLELYLFKKFYSCFIFIIIFMLDKIFE